jgi:L-fuconolactonase
MTIDSHVHFWKYDKKRDTWITNDMKILQQDYVVEQIKGTLSRNGVDGVIAVQADTSETETHFLVELANSHPEIKGVVGWIDLCNENIEDRLQYFSQYPAIKGYRYILQTEADDFASREDFQRGIAALAPYGYTYDVLVFPRHLPAVNELLKKFPEQIFIIDHCAKPSIKGAPDATWTEWMKKIAANGNAYCKLSGLLTEAEWKKWSAADFYPYLDVVMKAFGPERLLFGSDWPVILLSGMYVQWKSLLEKYMEHHSPEDREKVFGGVASRVYRV